MFDNFDLYETCEEYYTDINTFDFSLSPEDEDELNELFN